MRITVGQLRGIIREVLAEAGGASPTPPRPNVRNAMTPSMADREQIGRISVKDKDDPEEVSPHLREPMYKEDDCWGPVPPTGEDPYVMADFYTKDYHVIPTPPIKR